MRNAKAAVEEGIVAGGGVALIQAGQGRVRRSSSSRVTRRPVPASCASRLEAPLKQIAINAGLEGGVVAEKVAHPRGRVTASTPPPASTSTCIAAGIIDPAKVTRSALQNAASIAALFLTTEAVIADKPEKAAPAMPRWRRDGRHGLLAQPRGIRHDVEGRSTERWAALRPSPERMRRPSDVTQAGRMPCRTSSCRLPRPPVPSSWGRCSATSASGRPRSGSRPATPPWSGSGPSAASGRRRRSRRTDGTTRWWCSTASSRARSATTRSTSTTSGSGPSRCPSAPTCRRAGSGPCGAASPLRLAFGSCRTSVPHDEEGNASNGVDALRAYALRTTDQVEPGPRRRPGSRLARPGAASSATRCTPTRPAEEMQRVHRVPPRHRGAAVGPSSRTTRSTPTSTGWPGPTRPTAGCCRRCRAR